MDILKNITYMLRMTMLLYYGRLCNRRVIIFLPCDFYLSIFVSSFLAVQKTAELIEMPFGLWIRVG